MSEIKKSSWLESLSVYKDKFFFGQDKFNDLVKELKKDGLNIK